jgi:hypothetical protein
MAKEEELTATSTDVELYDHQMWPRLLDQDPEAVQARFAERFKQAKNIDDLFDVLEGNSSKNMVGRKVEVRDVAWAPYESDRGVIPNAIASAVDLDTGEQIEFATTSSALTLFIRQAELVGALPFRARIASKKTRSGREALNFERV